MSSLGDLWRGMTPPTFNHACPTCRTPSTSPRRCRACEDAEHVAREARVATAASLPTRFVLAGGLDGVELSARIDAVGLARARAIDLVGLDRVTLLGPAGAGKTTLAAALAMAWASIHGRAAEFVPAVDLGVARQQHGLGEGEPRRVLQAMAAPLLVLDDVGQEVEIGVPVVAHVLQHRYDHVKSTVATSGLTVDQLVARYGSGVARRLLETVGGATVLKLQSRGGRAAVR